MREDVTTRSSVAGTLTVLALALAGCMANDHGRTEGRSSALTALSPSFDWKMPDRTRVDGRNLLQPIEANPSTWTVTFDACASGPAGSITEYRWAFGDGKAAAGTNCVVSHDFPSEGVYGVTLTVAAADGSTATATRDVTVQDFLILAFGDSYASGEGSPNVEIPPSLLARWAQLNVEVAQKELERSHAATVLRAVDKLLGPVENLLTAITLRDAASCAVCTPDGLGEGACFLASAGAGFPAICFICKDECRNAAGRVTKATADLAKAMAEATTTAGLEYLQSFIDDPTGLKRELERLKDAWNLTIGTLDAALSTLKGERDLIPGLSKATWDDEQCHRSTFSAQARTALAMEAADPRTSVTFLHLSCSGAKSVHLYKDEYDGVIPDAGDPVRPQFEVAAGRIGKREVDAVLLSIGGNDADFAPLIFAGIMQEPTHQPGSPLFTRADEVTLTMIPGLCALTFFLLDDCFDYFDTAKGFGLGAPGLALFESGVTRLPDAYRNVNTNVLKFEGIGRDPGRVFITEYPDATRDENGNTCTLRLDRLPDLAGIPGWTNPEWAWAGGTVIPTINAAVKTAATEHGWTMVDGIYAGFSRHGVCADEPWINRIQQSFNKQGDPNGSVHPNRAGYAEIASHMVPKVRAKLFSGPGDAPRAPQVPPVASAGPSIVVDEGTSYTVVNDSFDPSRTGALEFAWSLAVTPASGASLSSPSATVPTLVAVDDTSGVLKVTVSNPNGSADASTTVRVRNVAPVVTAGGTLSTVEGTPLTVSATFVDPGQADTHVARVEWGDGTGSDIALAAGARALSATHTYLNHGERTVQITVRDDDGGAHTASVRVSVANAAPVLGALSGPTRPTRAGTVITVSAPFTDPGVLDTHTAIVDWGDGTTSPATVVASNGRGQATATHSYTRPGRREVKLTLTDDGGAAASASDFYVTTGPPVK